MPWSKLMFHYVGVPLARKWRAHPGHLPLNPNSDQSINKSAENHLSMKSASQRMQLQGAFAMEAHSTTQHCNYKTQLRAEAMQEALNKQGNNHQENIPIPRKMFAGACSLYDRSFILAGPALLPEPIRVQDL
jgi:hypothetical protein